MLLPRYLSDVRNIVLGGHEVSQVFEFQSVITAGNDGFVVSFDGNNVIWVIRTTYILEWFVENLAAFSV